VTFFPTWRQGNGNFSDSKEGIVFLTHPGIRYSIGVKEEWVDWDGHQRTEESKLRSPKKQKLEKAHNIRVLLVDRFS
jgi:hypothetical protein